MACTLLRILTFQFIFYVDIWVYFTLTMVVVRFIRLLMDTGIPSSGTILLNAKHLLGFVITYI